MTRSRRRLPLVLLVVLAVLAACGGGTPASMPVVVAAVESERSAVATPNSDLGGAAPGATPSAHPARSGTPAPPLSPSPSPPVPSAPAELTAPPAKPFAYGLYREGDFVPQYTFEWCVGASIQMTLAMTDTSHDMSRAKQQRVWELARDLSNSPFGGANPNGWVPALNQLGVGPYELVSLPDLASAVRVAARAMVATGRPVGLVMWRGRHAWMMSGFESVGDPRVHDDFRVTGVRVLDPLYPHGSSRWGPSPRPNSLLTHEQLGKQFVARTTGRINLGVPPGYMLILPRVAAE